MKYQWINVLLLLLMMVAPLRAQSPDPLPALTQVLADPSGAVTLFYPADWVDLQLTDEQTRIAGETITLTLKSLTIEPIFFDDVPDWLIAEGHLPENAFFSVETYADREMWVGQGENLFEEGQYSAVVAVMASSRDLILIQADFPASEIAEAGALVTDIWQQMVILPYHAQIALMNVHIADGWVFSDTGNEMWLAPDEADWALMVADETPLNLGIHLEVIQQNVTRAKLLQEAVVLDQQEITVNGSPTTLALRQSDGQTEILLLLQRTSDQFLLLRATGSDGEMLLDYLPLLKAIFASWQLG